MMDQLSQPLPRTHVGNAIKTGAVGPSWAEIELSPPSVSGATKVRDMRIDVLRGLSLLMIYVDHIPPNTANWFTLHNFSFSDAAEVFVFLAGTSSMLAYGQAFSRRGVVAGLRQIVTRCARIYCVQVCLFLVTITLALVRQRAGYPNPFVGPLLAQGWHGVVRGLTLEALPTYLDILPLYLIMLLAFPLIYLLSRVSPWLALGVSGALWLVTNLHPALNLPNVLNPNGWTFNPFAWQLLFTIGALSAAPIRSGKVFSPTKRRLRLACLAYLAFGFLQTLNWAHWGLPDLSPMSIAEPDKSLLSPFRLISILALIYLVFSTPGLQWLANHRFASPLAVCGRHSLEVFAMGCLLAYSGRFLFQFLGTDWPLQVAVNVVGIGATLAVALLLERRRVNAEAVARAGLA